MRAAAGMSPRVLVELLGTTTPLVLELWRSLDPAALGEPVSWAAPGPAPVWLDCARDFTEYWAHGQQIRDATGRPGGDAPDVAHAVLDTFLRAMPWTLRDTPGTALSVVVDGPAGGTWSWRRTGSGTGTGTGTGTAAKTVTKGARQ